MVLTMNEGYGKATRWGRRFLCKDLVSMGAAKYSVLFHDHVLLDVFRLLVRISSEQDFVAETDLH